MSIIINKDFDKITDKIIKNSLADTINKYKQGASVLLELPLENYFNASMITVKYLVDNGYQGVYVSFQRPFENLNTLFKQNGIDTSKIFIVDSATAHIEEKYKNKTGCIKISTSIEIDEFKKIIVKSLKGIKNQKKFILIDSLTTLALYKSPSEITKLSEKIMDLVKHEEFENVVVLFNVAEYLSKKEYIKDITISADEVIHVLNNTEKYSRDVVNPNIYT